MSYLRRRVEAHWKRLLSGKNIMVEGEVPEFIRKFNLDGRATRDVIRFRSDMTRKEIAS